jgi:hypothetical protein
MQTDAGNHDLHCRRGHMDELDSAPRSTPATTTYTVGADKSKGLLNSSPPQILALSLANPCSLIFLFKEWYTNLSVPF